MCLDHVPKLEQAPHIAGQVRRAWGVTPTSRLHLGQICDHLGIKVREVSLDVPRGGAQAFLIPNSSGNFTIEVDPEPAGGWPSVARSLRSSLARHRRRFLVAHELAHTLFYEQTSSGARRLVSNSDTQEEFCDELARNLLVPQQAVVTLPFSPSGVIKAQRRFDVSMEVALRSLVSAHGSRIAWLLLQRDREPQVQWTSARGNVTSECLHALKTLAKHAVRAGFASASLLSTGVRAEALYLRKREQVVVTWDCLNLA